jgi:hypothetical protein
MGSDVVFLVIKLCKLGRKEVAHIEHRLDTVSWRLGFKRFEEHPTIFQVDKCSMSCRYLRHSGVPAHPEDRSGESGYPAVDLRELHS